MNLSLAILFKAAAPNAHFVVALCSLIVCGLVVATVLCWPRRKPRPKFQILTFIALLGSTMLWGGVLTLVADPSEKLPTTLYYVAEVILYGGIALWFIAIFMQWAAVRDEREGRALP